MIGGRFLQFASTNLNQPRYTPLSLADLATKQPEDEAALKVDVFLFFFLAADTVDGKKIPNNHLGWCWNPVVNN